MNLKHMICGRCFSGEISAPGIHSHTPKEPETCCWCGRKATDAHFKVSPAFIKPEIAAVKP